MGREIALAVPEAMDVYRRASEASGLDLMRLCFEAPEHELVQTDVQQPALAATSLAVLAALRARGYEPDFVVGHSVGEFAALAASQALGTEDAIALVRQRGLAMAAAARENPGSMAAILGLDDEIVENLCLQIANVWPANYNCPGQIVISGENPSVDACCDEAAAPRRAPHGQAPRVGCVPQPAGRPGGRGLAARDRAREVLGADRPVHVDGHGQDRAGAAAGRSCSSSS